MWEKSYLKHFNTRQQHKTLYKLSKALYMKSLSVELGIFAREDTELY